MNPSISKKTLLALTLAALACCLTAVLAVGCSGSQSTTSQSGSSSSSDGTFVQALSSIPSTLQPSTTSDDQVTATRPVFDVLFAETKDGLEYYLADSLKVSDDGLTYTLHINDKANWSDGQPITADDFLFTVDYAGLSRGGSSSYNTINKQAATISKKDDKTVEIVLPQAYASYELTLSRMYLLPSHCFDNDPSKVDNSGFSSSTDMVTSGAYTVSEINADSLVFNARDDYYRGTPEVKSVVMKTIGSGSTRQVAFENGEISYMRITSSSDLTKYQSASDKYNLYSFSEARLNYLQLNPTGPTMSGLSEDARKALFMALDQQEILDAAYGSNELAQPANSVLTPDQSLYNESCSGYSQNLDEAKSLAESSGLSGTTLVYIYNSDRPNMEAVATVVQQQLAKIGVTVDLQGLDSSTFFSRFFSGMYNKGTGDELTWDLGSNGWDSERGTNLGQAFSYFSSWKSAWGWSDTVSNLAVQTNSATTSADAQKYADQLQDQVLSEYWMYPLTYTNYIMVSQKNVTGLDGSTVIPEFIDYLKIKVN